MYNVFNRVQADDFIPSDCMMCLSVYYRMQKLWGTVFTRGDSLAKALIDRYVCVCVCVWMYSCVVTRSLRLLWIGMYVCVCVYVCVDVFMRGGKLLRL